MVWGVIAPVADLDSPDALKGTHVGGTGQVEIGGGRGRRAVAADRRCRTWHVYLGAGVGLLDALDSIIGGGGVSIGTVTSALSGNIGTAAHLGDMDPNSGLDWVPGTADLTSLSSVGLGMLVASIGPHAAPPLHTLAFADSATVPIS